jgi:hypothetical protein
VGVAFHYALDVSATMGNTVLKHTIMKSVNAQTSTVSMTTHKYLVSIKNIHQEGKYTYGHECSDMYVHLHTYMCMHVRMCHE